MFGGNECSLHGREQRPMKIMEQRNDITAASGGGMNGRGKMNPNDPGWQNGNTVGLHDNRIVWAALTPGGGTQHFISENYPKDFVDYRYSTFFPLNRYKHTVIISFRLSRNK